MAPLPDLGDIVHASYNPIVRAIRELEKPVICAVNGVAAGAGANLALACDILIAAEEASFIQSFAKIGLIPDTGGTFFLPRLVGLHRATAMMMLGEKVTAARARGAGDSCTRSCRTPCSTIRPSPWRGRSPSQATRGLGTDQARAQPVAGRRSRLAARIRGGAAARGGQDRDYEEGVRAFLEKRKPTFTGQ